MAKNIYVGNLTWGTTADDLLALFQEHGKVTRAQVITDRETGRSRGFGFVEMENDAEAQKAIDALNGQPFRGRPLTVNEARPREAKRAAAAAGPGAAAAVAAATAAAAVAAATAAAVVAATAVVVAAAVTAGAAADAATTEPVLLPSEHGPCRPDA